MTVQLPPKRAAAFILNFPIYGDNLTPQAAAAGLDSEISKDGGAFADCTNEATEIGATGIYSLTLTSTEMTADFVFVQTKTTSLGTVGHFVRTAESTWDEGIDVKAVLTGAIVAGSFGAGAIDAAAIATDAIGAAELADGAITAATFAAGAIDATAIATDAIGAAELADGAITAATFAAGAIDATAIATDAIGAAELADGAITAATFAASAIDATSIATGAITAAKFAAGAIDAAAIATNAIGAAELAADAVTEIAAGITIPAAATIAAAVWDEDATGHQSAGTFGLAIGDPAASTETLYKAIVTDPAGTNIAADVIAIKAETVSILDDTDDIGVAGAGLTALATQASVNTIDDFLDTEIAAIKAKTDQLTFTVANQIDANALTIDEDEILDDALIDSVPADGSLPTVRQALYMLTQFMLERSVSGTTVTVKKADGTTSLFTLTIDSATAPTSITRAT